MNGSASLIVLKKGSLYCPAGDFYIDPMRGVERAIVTHAHSDHARTGSKAYIAARDGLGLLQHRLGREAPITAMPYGQQFVMKDALVSLHPAGHILGSAQVRIESQGEVWAVTGDYKRDPDPTCLPFEIIPCDVLVTEATFGLPIYRWDPGPVVAEQILAWWEHNREQNRTSVLFCYALGKAQRVMAELARLTERTVYLHGAVYQLSKLYQEAGIRMTPFEVVSDTGKKADLKGELVIAPPAAFRSVWMKRFKDFETGFASGWMRVRAARRYRAYDRGFVLSDHADWPQLIRTVEETAARRVLAMHGKTDVLVRYLSERGFQAEQLRAGWYKPDEDALSRLETVAEV
jgi:putative mRNA 3-end processing factor